MVALKLLPAQAPTRYHALQIFWQINSMVKIWGAWGFRA